MASPKLEDFLPLISLLLFLVGAVLSFHNLSARDRGTARAAYIWMSIPGTVTVALHIGHLIYAEHYYPGYVDNPFFLVFILLYVTFNPGWAVFPAVLVCAGFSRSSSPADKSALLLCCLLAALWIWGFLIDIYLLPNIQIEG
jgi:hypothetical protein